MEPEKIDVGWCDPGNVSGEFAVSLAATVRDLEYFGAMGKLHRVGGSILVWARNEVVKKFLAGNSTWLWMVDSDMVFDKGHVQKLWECASEHGVKMVSGLAFIFKDQQQPVPSVFYPGEDDPLVLRQALNMIPGKPTVVSATGMASTLIHREVFEAMQAPRHEGYRWFDLVEVTHNEGIAGEDVQFFVRAKELGYDLMIEPNAETWHIKSIGIGRKDFDRYWELRRAA